MKRMLAFLLVLMTLTASACAEELTVWVTMDMWIQEIFQAEHPEVTLTESRMEGYPLNASEMAGKMLTREFDYDVFTAMTAYSLPQELIDKGYVLDLSGSEIIREAVSRLYPALQAQVTRDGKIYAFPNRVELDPLPQCGNPDVWAELGYTEADVPQSFGEYLDFLDAWVARQQEDPQPQYWVYNTMDELIYDEAWYTMMLTRQLMENYILQKQYAGEPLTFDEPELLALLERVRATGAAIYGIEPVKTESMGAGRPLFSRYVATAEQRAAWHVPMRLNREQPDVLCGRIDMAMVYAGTDAPELAIQYIECVVQNNEDYLDTDIYVDAQPIVNEAQGDRIRHWSNLIALAEHRLANDRTPYTEYMDLEGWTQSELNDYASNAAEIWDWPDSTVRERADTWQWYLERAYEEEYIVSPEELAEWAQFMETMYFPGPGAFSPTTDVGVNFYSLIDQFAEGVISAGQLTQEAARIAWMVEMENQ